MNSGTEFLADADAESRKVEAAYKLQQPLTLPANTDKVFGQENFNFLGEILTDREILDLDLLWLEGDIESPEQAIDYARQVDPFHRARNDLALLSEKIVASRKEKIPREIGCSVVQNKKGWGYSTTNGIFRFVSLISKIRAGLEVPLCKTRSALLQDFLESLISRYSSGVFSTLEEYKQQKTRGHEITVEVINCLYDRLDKLFLEAGGLSFSGHSVQMAVANLTLMSRNEGYKSSFMRMLEDTESLDDDCELLAVSGLEKFEQINSLSCFRRLLPHKASIDQGEIEIVGDDIYTSPMQAATSVAMLRVNLDRSVPYSQIQLMTDTPNDKLYFQQLNKAAFELILNRSSGELELLGTGLPLSCFMHEIYYLKLKNLVFDVLLNYLLSKEDDVYPLLDVEEVQLRRMERLEPPRREVVSDIVNLLPQLETDSLEDIIPAFAPIAADLETGAVIDAHGKVSYARQIAGMRPQIIKQRLIQLLGRPVRIRGSHHIFQSRENGNTYPVPFHSSRDRMDPRVLFHSLKHLGISQQEFYAGHY